MLERIKLSPNMLHYRIFGGVETCKQCTYFG